MRFGIAIMVLIAASAFGRIGETEAEIEARYGKSMGVMSKANEPIQRGYLHAGLRIGVTFIDGKSVSEWFAKDDKSTLTDHEKELLLEANSNGLKWWKAPSSLTPFGM